MCFSAEASAGVAVALLPTGAYCLQAAWRKDRAYLPIAAVPLLFGLQQVCEGAVWAALDRGDSEAARVPLLGFLFFAFAVWPVWVPLAAAAIEPPGWNRRTLFALAACGVLYATTYYLPIAANSGRGLGPGVVGHSIRYDFSAVPVIRSSWWWVWPLLYLVAACGPSLASRDRRLRPLGVAVLLAAVVTYALFAYAFTSVWCLFAAVLSVYLAYVLDRLPDRPA